VFGDFLPCRATSVYIGTMPKLPLQRRKEKKEREIKKYINLFDSNFFDFRTEVNGGSAQLTPTKNPHQVTGSIEALDHRGEVAEIKGVGRITDCWEKY